MTLSREIVVLDLKEKVEAASGGVARQEALQERSSDDLISTSEGFAQKSPLKARQRSLAAHQQAANQDQASSFSDAGAGSLSSLMGGEGGESSSPSLPNMHCLSSQSLLLLICSIGLFFVLYVCLVAYFFARRDTKISVIKHQYH